MAQDIYVNAGEISGKLLKKPKVSLEKAEKSLGYNYSMDAYLEVAISVAKYVSPNGRQRLFDTSVAESIGTIHADLCKALQRLETYETLLNSGPDALAEIDAAYKNKMTNWRDRMTCSVGGYYTAWASRTKGFYEGLFCRGGNGTGEDTVVDPHATNKQGIREEIEREYRNCNIYSYWGISQNDVEKIIVSSSSDEEARRLLQLQLKDKLDQAANNRTTIDISQYSTQTYYDYYGSDGNYYSGWGLYEITGGCTWFAFNRYREMNDKDLLFHGAGGGNAQDWNDRIDENSFTKINPKELQVDGIINAIAVDDQGSPINGVYYGHVVYVEAILNGDVYITEGWYSGGGFHQSGVRKLTYEEFANTYETVIVAK